MALSPWCFPCRHWRMLLDTPKVMSTPGWPSPAPSGSPQRARDPAMTISSVSTKLAPVYWLFPLWGIPKEACSSLDVISAKSGIPFHPSTGHAPVGIAQDVIGPHCWQGHCWLTLSLLPTSALRAFPAELLSSQALPACHCEGLLLSRSRTWHFSLLNLVKVLLARSSRLSRPLWIAALSSNILSGAFTHLQTWWECSPSPPPCRW